MKTNDVIRGAEDGLAGGLEHVRGDLSTLRRDVAHLMSRSVHEVAGRASDRAGAIGAGINELAEGGRVRAEAAYEVVSDFVSRRPVVAIAIAVGIGALALGFLSLRGRRD